MALDVTRRIAVLAFLALLPATALAQSQAERERDAFSRGHDLSSPEAQGGCRDVSAEEIMRNSVSQQYPGNWPGVLVFTAGWDWSPVSIDVEGRPGISWGCRGYVDIRLPSGQHVIQAAQAYRRSDGKLVVWLADHF